MQWHLPILEFTGCVSPIEEDDENPSEDMHHSYYIAGTPSEDEDDEYLSDEILSEGDFNDEQWLEEDIPFHVDIDNEEAWLYPENLHPCVNI